MNGEIQRKLEELASQQISYLEQKLALKLPYRFGEEFFNLQMILKVLFSCLAWEL
jgi:hypothetical protein